MKVLRNMMCMITLGAVLVSCSARQSEKEPARLEGVIQLGYPSEQSFKQRYSDLLEREFPDLTVNIVPIGRDIKDAAEAEALLKRNPDLDALYVPWFDMHDYIDGGALKELDTLTKKDNYDLSMFIPASIDLARQYGNGTLYGLPTLYNGKAIIVNLDLFQRYNVEPPQDQMSWAELLQTAVKFAGSGSGETGVTGIEFPFSAATLLNEIGWSRGLTMFDDQEQIVSINTDGWKSIWQQVIPAMQSGDLRFELNPTVNRFLDGECAMYYASVNEFKRVVTANPKFRWSVVTLPVDPSARDKTNRFTIDGLYAVASTTKQTDKAWMLVQFLCSETAARWVDNRMQGTSTLVSQNTKAFADAFYKLSPTLPPIGTLTMKMYQLLDQTVQDAAANKVPLDAALDELQAQAEAVKNEKE